ncbi:Uncharacterized protein HZ326_3623 [Fusarium oxysporum f. sp. albedinis]|nr:Uncharacterized protein HZ326_3623 [Fusarium oxysporum f. sp. albedinis]
MGFLGFFLSHCLISWYSEDLRALRSRALIDRTVGKKVVINPCLPLVYDEYSCEGCRRILIRSLTFETRYDCRHHEKRCITASPLLGLGSLSLFQATSSLCSITSARREGGKSKQAIESFCHLQRRENKTGPFLRYCTGGDIASILDLSTTRVSKGREEKRREEETPSIHATLRQRHAYCTATRQSLPGPGLGRRTQPTAYSLQPPVAAFGQQAKGARPRA